MKKIINFILVAFFLIVFILPNVVWSQESWREKLRKRWSQRIEKKQATKESHLKRLLLGIEHKQMIHDGLQRSYCQYLPADIKKTKNKHPLVIILHGGGGTGKYMAILTGFNRLAEQDKFMVVYPDGIEKHWNDGRNLQEYKSQRENIDDVGFISALIDKLAAQYPVDLEHIYVAGISNGAFMTHRLATELSGKIAAAAMVIGSISEPYFSKAIPSRPVPIIIMNGTKDPLVPWKGGEIGFKGRTKKGRAVSVEQTVNFWLKYNKCETSGQMIYKPDRDPEDGTRVRVHSYKNRAGKVMVIFYAIEEGGHTWPGVPEHIPQAPRQVPKTAIGLTCFDINGTNEIYNFFKQHSGKLKIRK